MDGKTIVGGAKNFVLSLAGFVSRANLNTAISEGLQLMQKLMSNLFRDLVPFPHRKLAIHSNIEFSMETMPDPSCACFTHIFDSLDMTGAMNDFFEDLRFHTVKHPGENYLTRVPNDEENCNGNGNSNQWIRHRI